MAEKVQLTVRFDEETLREAQFYLRLERSSLTAFCKEKVQEFVAEYRQRHPERVPGGIHAHRVSA
jgi:hypothetical protein